MPYPKTHWLKTVPADARAEIERIMDDVEYRSSGVRHGTLYHWWVRLTPSTRTPTDVVLIARTNDYPDREWPILANGRLVADPDRATFRR